MRKKKKEDRREIKEEDCVGEGKRQRENIKDDCVLRRKEKKKREKKRERKEKKINDCVSVGLCLRERRRRGKEEKKIGRQCWEGDLE